MGVTQRATMGWRGWSWLGACAVMVAACGDPDPGETPPDEEQDPPEMMGQAEVGPEGGTLELGEVTLEVPEGALEETVTFAVRVGAATPPSVYGQTSPMYTLEPAGVEFAEPIEVRYPLPDSITTPGVLLSAAGEDPTAADNYDITDGCAQEQAGQACATITRTGTTFAVQALARQRVGPEGGLVETGEGITLEFPEGALEAEETVTVLSQVVEAPEGVEALTTAYSFGPSGRPTAEPFEVGLDLGEIEEDAPLVGYWTAEGTPETNPTEWIRLPVEREFPEAGPNALLRRSRGYFRYNARCSVFIARAPSCCVSLERGETCGEGVDSAQVCMSPEEGGACHWACGEAPAPPAVQLEVMGPATPASIPVDAATELTIPLRVEGGELELEQLSVRLGEEGGANGLSAELEVIEYDAEAEQLELVAPALESALGAAPLYVTLGEQESLEAGWLSVRLDVAAGSLSVDGAPAPTALPEGIKTLEAWPAGPGHALIASSSAREGEVELHMLRSDADGDGLVVASSLTDAGWRLEEISARAPRRAGEPTRLFLAPSAGGPPTEMLVEGEQGLSAEDLTPLTGLLSDPAGLVDLDADPTGEVPGAAALLTDRMEGAVMLASLGQNPEGPCSREASISSTGELSGARWEFGTAHTYQTLFGSAQPRPVRVDYAVAPAELGAIGRPGEYALAVATTEGTCSPNAGEQLFPQIVTPAAAFDSPEIATRILDADGDGDADLAYAGFVGDELIIELVRGRIQDGRGRLTVSFGAPIVLTRERIASGGQDERARLAASALRRLAPGQSAAGSHLDVALVSNPRYTFLRDGVIARVPGDRIFATEGDPVELALEPCHGARVGLDSRDPTTLERCVRHRIERDSGEDLIVGSDYVVSDAIGDFEGGQKPIDIIYAVVPVDVHTSQASDGTDVTVALYNGARRAVVPGDQASSVIEPSAGLELFVAAEALGESAVRLLPPEGITLGSGSGYEGNTAHSAGWVWSSGVREAADGEGFESVVLALELSEIAARQRANPDQPVQFTESDVLSMGESCEVGTHRASCSSDNAECLNVCISSTCSPGDASCQRELVWRPVTLGQADTLEQSAGELRRVELGAGDEIAGAHIEIAELDPSSPGPEIAVGLSAAEGSGAVDRVLIEGSGGRIWESAAEAPTTLLGAGAFEPGASGDQLLLATSGDEDSPGQGVAILSTARIVSAELVSDEFLPQGINASSKSGDDSREAGPGSGPRLPQLLDMDGDGYTDALFGDGWTCEDRSQDGDDRRACGETNHFIVSPGGGHATDVSSAFADSLSGALPTLPGAGPGAPWAQDDGGWVSDGALVAAPRRTRGRVRYNAR